MNPPSLDNLEELRSRREAIHSCIAAAGDTLAWFAEHFSQTGGIPLNAWHRSNRPFGREARTLGLAFDLWHAIFRAERTVRLTPAPLQSRLTDAGERVRRKLLDLTNCGKDEELPVYARRIISDEIYGTCNALSAAAVLRAEVFPERFEATPSYLAGHVVVAELRLARESAHGYRMGGDPLPRLAVVSQSVHSLMLYVEHLRGRSELFRRIQDEIESLEKLRSAARGIPSRAQACSETLWNGHLRLAMARLASACDECASLLLATRPFFKEWHNRLEEEAYRSGAVIHWENIERTLLHARAKAQSALGDPAGQQLVARDNAWQFCTNLGTAYAEVSQAVKNVLGDAGPMDYAALCEALVPLQKGLAALEKIVLGGSPRGEYPSITDAAHFQFVEDLVARLSDRDGNLYSLADLAQDEVRMAVADALRVMNQTYSLRVDTGDAETATAEKLAACACVTYCALAASAAGATVRRWWERRADCYAVRSGTTGGGGEEWITLRHRSFEAIATLRSALASATTLSDAAEAFREAADAERQVADDVSALVKRLTKWCSLLGHQLLLAGRGGAAGVGDPHDLAAALWIAERIGEPWNERLEEEALALIQQMQRPDGSFGPAAPLYQNRGFAFYLPTASTIAVLARFATGGTRAPNTPALRARLQRWAPVLIEGAGFLTDSMVGHGRDAHARVEDTGLAGWHTDRHPEAERIDCLATTEAVTALCRLDDALKWLINLKAASEFKVEWPEPRWATAHATDLEKGKDQLLLRVAQLIGWHRAQTGSYKAPPQRGPRYHDEVVAHYAFVLYGPPGTGKTHFQSILAGELGWPLVTLTIGDFLHDGEDRLGRRTVDVFRRLAFLCNACIVFDEFDEMVADRGEKDVPRLPLLTAAILPLLATLREQARANGCIVTFTTNYLENIDRAAIRGGRVDESLLLMYPDYHSRMLLGLMQHDRPNAGCEWQPLRRAVRQTAMCAYSDVVAYLKREMSGIAGHGVGTNPPKAAIDERYYDMRKVDDRLKDTLAKLLHSIGPEDVQREWLGEHEEWQKLWDLFAPPSGGTQETTDIRPWPDTIISVPTIGPTDSPASGALEGSEDHA